jgi:hypothetical protein
LSGSIEISLTRKFETPLRRASAIIHISAVRMLLPD